MARNEILESTIIMTASNELHGVFAKYISQ